MLIAIEGETLTETGMSPVGSKVTSTDLMGSSWLHLVRESRLALSDAAIVLAATQAGSVWGQVLGVSSSNLEVPVANPWAQRSFQVRGRASRLRTGESERAAPSSPPRGLACSGLSWPKKLALFE